MNSNEPHELLQIGTDTISKIDKELMEPPILIKLNQRLKEMKHYKGFREEQTFVEIWTYESDCIKESLHQNLIKIREEEECQNTVLQ